MSPSKKRPLSPRSRAILRVGVPIQFALQGLTLWDLAHRPADQVRGPKKAWVAASFVNFIGPIAYLRWGRRNTPPPVAAAPPSISSL
ncbi:hypothetical protein GYA93_11485 [Gordonia desulfuricans]|uniref:Cardiolipin synthase N-terminal domain-containing protein n=1 Tax=Gordonia desulfuricans TaxID=89051 RepID=A0A7K3LPR0_9ACTN|nr:PLDc N-terminal domain-containing protein [Gordonia desulfuricans]NDK90198.1 hypothetical protein [Gordonia desulfuricans]